MRITICFLTLVAGLSVSSGRASAQMACPQGVSPGSSQCLPTGGTVAPPARGPRWVLTWGAMAEDQKASIVGTSSGELSRRAAQRAAVKKCETMGGVGCKAVYSYKNTCAVIAEPIALLESMHGYYQNGPTVEEATRLVIPQCRSGNGGNECRVIYSNCTSPILKQ